MSDTLFTTLFDNIVTLGAPYNDAKCVLNVTYQASLSCLFGYLICPQLFVAMSYIVIQIHRYQSIVFPLARAIKIYCISLSSKNMSFKIFIGNNLANVTYISYIYIET